MGASAGAGHPMSFMCTRLRRVPWAQRTNPIRDDHEVTRTGRTKPNPSRRLQGRALATLHEYRCTCGHVGWTSHPDVMLHPQETI